MKTCFRCQRLLPLDEFYKHSAMLDGHLNKCKDCTKSDAIANYDRRRQDPAFVASELKRGRDKYARLYAAGPNWQSPDAPIELKRQARNALNHAVAQGTITKPKQCEECGRSCRIHGHHEDYTRPLEVDWLCPACHRRRHALYPERVKASA